MAEYIEREAALAFQNDLEPCLCRSAATGEVFSATKDADLVAYLHSIPAADVRPVVKATWIVKEMQALFHCMDEHPVFVCSKCGYQIYDLLDNVKERHHFCPNCGSDMRGGDGNG